MEPNMTLGVYRRMDDLSEGLPKDSEKALALHRLRKEALHEILDHQEIVQVIDWGDTDDTVTHEYVELILGITATTIVQPFINEGLKWLGKKLAEKAVEETTSAFVKWIITKLAKKQQEQKILDFHIRLRNGTVIRVDPPKEKSAITINVIDSETVSIKYE